MLSATDNPRPLCINHFYLPNLKTYYVCSVLIEQIIPCGFRRFLDRHFFSICADRKWMLESTRKNNRVCLNCLTAILVLCSLCTIFCPQTRCIESFSFHDRDRHILNQSAFRWVMLSTLFRTVEQLASQKRSIKIVACFQ